MLQTFLENFKSSNPHEKPQMIHKKMSSIPISTGSKNIKRPQACNSEAQNQKRQSGPYAARFAGSVNPLSRLYDFGHSH